MQDVPRSRPPVVMNALGTLLSWSRSLGANPRAIYQRLSAASLRQAAREQDLEAIIGTLRRIVPDVQAQYSYDIDADEYRRYWEIKLRGLHAFQVRSALAALDLIGGSGLVVADIGDSSGNHGLCLRTLAADKIGRFVSVNLDRKAVDKVRARGGEAVLCRAERLSEHGIHADLFISFETVEHLTDPLRFLHALSADSESRGYVLFSVPYRRVSRFGGGLLRQPEATLPETLTAESVHIFELCPADWMLMSRLAGFRVVFSRIYRQYPQRSWLRATAPLWRALDFEGFVCLFLQRDLSLANRYRDW